MFFRKRRKEIIIDIPDSPEMLYIKQQDQNIREIKNQLNILKKNFNNHLTAVSNQFNDYLNDINKALNNVELKNNYLEAQYKTEQLKLMIDNKFK